MTSRRYLTVFYVVVVGVALTGAGQAATGWLGWPALFAFAAVAAVELGGVVISHHAGERMRLGERAIIARLLSAAVAAGAVSVNWFGHHADSVGQAAFFAGMSALGYLVWLIDTSARRRDQLRVRGMLATVPPAYGLAQWLRHPWLTREARALAVADPTLGLHRSLEAAAAAARRRTRHAAIAVLLRRKLSAGRDQVAAELAIATYDLDEIAARLAAAADYDGLTALLGADLTAAAVAGVPDTQPDTAPVTEPVVDTVRTAEDIAGASGDTAGGEASRVKLPTEAARTIAQSLYLANPDMPMATIADMIGMSTRTVRRYLADVGRPTSAPPALDGVPTAEWPTVPRALDADDALAQLGTVADPGHRRHLAEVALFGPTATEQAERRAAFARGEADRVREQAAAAA